MGCASMRSAGAALLATAALIAAPARAEVAELKIGKQYGFPYMQLIVMQDQGLIEKQAKAAGIELKVDWVTLGGPAQLNDGLISGAIDIAAVGMSNLVTLWSKTRGNIGVKAISGMNAMPLILVTRNPAIRTLKDYGASSRIALPSVKISMQAILLQIAVAREFGDANWTKLDPLTVSMGHPDAMAALLSRGAEIDSHFSSAPFQYQELAQPGIHRVISSYDIIGPHSVSAISTRTKFYQENPKTIAALLAALGEATDWVQHDKRAAAEAYLRVTKEKTAAEGLVRMMADPEILITLTPMGAEKIAAFLHRIGAVKDQPASWRDLYFPNVAEGS
jgi:NitT/TauT family transport system substrate-binding protein